MKFIILGLLICLNIFAESAFANFDHSHLKWDQILKQYTTKNENQVYFNYNGLKNNEDELSHYLRQLELVTKKEFNTFSRDQKLAFWINAYNAYTIQIILKNYPVKSIKDISSGWFSSGPWKKDFINLFGKTMSLDNIEHDIIRKEFAEPRIHFAVNCASIGCPYLLQEAFVANRLSIQLDKAAINFLHNKSKNFLKGNTLYLSKIFDWYGNDFNPIYGSFKNYIIKTLNLAQKKYDVEFNDYNWNLNEIK